MAGEISAGLDFVFPPDENTGTEEITNVENDIQESIQTILPNYIEVLEDNNNNHDQNYFYSTYDKDKRFYYTINRNEIISNIELSEEEQQELIAKKQEAWLKCFDYHISFQRILPEWIKFYTFKPTIIINNNNTQQVTIDSNTDWYLLPTINTGVVSKEQYENRYIFNDSKLNTSQKIELRQNYLSRTNPQSFNGKLSVIPQFKDCVNSTNATLINKLTYELASRVQIDFSQGTHWNENDYVAQLSQINSLFKFNLPTKPGTYIKHNNQWIPYDITKGNIGLEIIQEQIIKEVMKGG